MLFISYLLSNTITGYLENLQGLIQFGQAPKWTKHSKNAKSLPNSFQIPFTLLFNWKHSNSEISFKKPEPVLFDIIQTKHGTMFLKEECFHTYKHDLKAMTEIFGEHFSLLFVQFYHTASMCLMKINCFDAFSITFIEWKKKQLGHSAN